MRGKLSAFVVTYNRASLLETCLLGVSFADELIVVDKSSTDNSVAVATRYADRVEIVPWSPTVEETRAFAASLCRHDWILCLDDDEILSAETASYLRGLDDAEADIYTIPYRHYILGEHDERAYYWPESRHCLFRKGAIEYTPTVHGGVAPQSDRIVGIPAESGVCIHHLSYSDVAGWIERTNRYTSRPDRIQPEGGRGDLVQFCHDRIDEWRRRTVDTACNDYPAAVALLRAIYDMVDRLKAWESERGVDGDTRLRAAQRELEAAFAARDSRDGAAQWRRQEVGADETDAAPVARSDGGTQPDGDNGPAEFSIGARGMLVRLRTAEAQLRERLAVMRRSDARLASTRRERDEALAALVCTRNELAAAGPMLNQCRMELRETRAALGASQSALGASQAALDENRAAFDATDAALGETRRALDESRRGHDETRTALDHTQATLEQAREALDRSRATEDQSQAALDQTREMLDQARAALAKATVEAEQLSNSARRFMRQYLPKLRRHLLNRRR